MGPVRGSSQEAQSLRCCRRLVSCGQRWHQRHPPLERQGERGWCPEGWKEPWGLPTVMSQGPRHVCDPSQANSSHLQTRGPPSSPSDDKGRAWEQVQTHRLLLLPPLSQQALPWPPSSPRGGSGFPRGGEWLPRSHGLCCRCPVTGAWRLGSISRDRAPRGQGS